MMFVKSGNPLLLRVLNKIVVKNEDTFVENSFDLPEMNIQMVKCRDSGIISILNGVVHSNIINCLNAGDVDGAVSYINQDNVDTETNIVEGVLQGLTIKLTNIKTELRYAAECIYVNEDTRTKKIDKLTKEKDELESKMCLIRERIKATDMCTVCLEKPRVKTITKCCNNSFCFECLASWLRRKTSCPLCKHPICIESDLYVVKAHEETGKIETSTKTDPTKLQFLQGHLSKITQDMKILIFSENDNSFVAIEKMLIQLGIKHAKLKGNSINRVVDEYKNGSLQVLLVNSNAYGSGLNLENTTDCILLHKFDNEAENQVLGRAQRPGRTKPLNVIYLLNNNEMQQH
jgi:SNF2 family DNA or RNA helicase